MNFGSVCDLFSFLVKHKSNISQPKHAGHFGTDNALNPTKSKRLSTGSDSRQDTDEEAWTQAKARSNPGWDELAAPTTRQRVQVAQDGAMYRVRQPDEGEREGSLLLMHARNRQRKSQARRYGWLITAFAVIAALIGRGW